MRTIKIPTPEERRLLDIENKQKSTEPLVERIKTATEIYYENKDKSDLLLEDLKALRIGALKEECQQSIFDGFLTPYGQFKFNITDQANMTQMFLLVVAGRTQDIQWKAVDKGVVTLTVEDFKGVVAASEHHKLTEQAKYWELESQIKNALTKEDVKAVIW